MLGRIGNDAILLFANDVLTAESEGQSQRMEVTGIVVE